MIICDYCGKYFLKEYVRHNIIEAINNNEKIIAYCCNDCTSKANLKFANKYWKENPEEKIKQSKINVKRAIQWHKDHPKESLKISLNNLDEANKIRIKKIKDEISKLNLAINENSININNIKNLCENDICGSYVLKGKYKNDKSHQIYNLLVCKSIKVYKEIYWILRVLSQPEK